MGRRRRTLVRLAVAAFLTLPMIPGAVAVSSAAPSKAEVEAAKARLEELNRSLDLLIEQYNQTKLALQEAQASMRAAERDRRQARAAADRAIGELSDRAVAAYTGMGSQLDVLLGAESLTEFSDRLEFMGALAQSDADVATAAEAAGEKAGWAADRYEQAAADRQATLDALGARQTDIQAAINEQRSLYEQLDRDYQDYVAAQRAAREAAEQAALGVIAAPSSSSAPVFVPPPNATGAQIAIAAAQSVIGTTYVWGSADPSVGFDCSGLTSWAWAQAGVYLPHSSEAQYLALPHVSQDQLAPGDLLFFYTPISHVSLYIGGGMHIDASYPGPGGEVKIEPVYWQSFVGAARPG